MGMLSSYADRLYSRHEIVPLVWLKVAEFVTDADEHLWARVCVWNVYNEQSGFLQSDKIWLLLLPKFLKQNVFFVFADSANMCLCVCVGVRLSCAALCNLMSYLCPEEGNGDSWLELHTAALPRALRPTDRQADRLVSDIIRKWKHWTPLYGFQSAITRVRLYIGS